jgi:formamidopyrimidine-DNA glycosylase
MPELPEVETIVGDLKKNILGLTIQDIWYDWKKQFRLPKDPREFKKIVAGRKITGLRRRAKNILIDLSGSRLLLIHQKMTGHLLMGKWKIDKNKPVSLLRGPLREKVNDYIHLIFYLSGGKELALSDLRKFAKVMAGPRKTIENLPDLAGLGSEPLDKNFGISKFRDLIHKERRPIKQVLMDQNVIAGIGNIYSDEILWKAKIFPLKKADKLSAARLGKIFRAMKTILRKAIRLRGTSTSDFRDPAGREGRYTFARKVYRREGKPCPRCQTAIKRVKIGGRSTHFCPSCQSD